MSFSREIFRASDLVKFIWRLVIVLNVSKSLSMFGMTLSRAVGEEYKANMNCNIRSGMPNILRASDM